MSPKSRDDTQTRARRLLDDLADVCGPNVWRFDRISDLEPGRTILAAGPDTAAAIVRLALTRVAGLPRAESELTDRQCRFLRACQLLIPRLLRRKLPLTDADVVALADLVIVLDPISLRVMNWLGAAVNLIERQIETNGLGDPLRAALDRLVDAPVWGPSQDERSLRRRLLGICRGPGACLVEPGEAWSDAALRDLRGMSDHDRAAWNELTAHCQSGPSGQPSSRWTETATNLIDSIGRDTFRKHVLRWFPLVDEPRTAVIADWPEGGPDPNDRIIEPHADILKGLVWCCASKEDVEMARALAALAISAYCKLPGLGPRAVKIGNACVWALGHMPGMEGVGQLALLKVRVKFGTAQKLIDKALTAAAQRLGLPRDEIEEMAVSAYGMTEVGVRRDLLGDYTAELTVTDTTSTALRWLKPDGKPQKSVPAAVRTDFADELRELKQAAKDIQKMLPAQRERIDQLFLQRKSWPYETWRERYLDHPLVGVIARRLIWRFARKGRTADGVFQDGRLVDRQDQAVDLIGPDARVELWHPLGVSADVVLGWRRWLEEHEIRQPFKQAHREVYVLTDAERGTGVYSNRFAAHILRQHQFNALCAARGWKNKLRLMVDDEFPPASRLLPHWGLRAEFWIDGVGEHYGVDTNESSVFHHVATDQVRFYPIDAAQRTAHAFGGGYGPAAPDGAAPALPLENIPPLVLSEIMRDVDLFVGVASVGNDPRWLDGERRERDREYWTDYSFGDLSESATTRKDVLERLIPRLRISDRCSFSDKFLVVRGDLRTYKIHLGSANILMEPNDQYLCIVPARGVAAGNTIDRLYLPFEGDDRLAVILSKALMLAEDTKITNSTILNQIRRPF